MNICIEKYIYSKKYFNGFEVTILIIRFIAVDNNLLFYIYSAYYRKCTKIKIFYHQLFLIINILKLKMKVSH